ncbi:hypothetical protein SY88_00250 [Clostridiales bacterium PH28_bin88]|nr:hypothetical protein SY88_00250 [Clostridiales bacterium PH28_bin88]
MPAFILQIVSFLQQALTWVVALAVPATALTVGYHALMRATAQDDMAAMHHARALKNALIYGVIVILAGSITIAVLGAF